MLAALAGRLNIPLLDPFREILRLESGIYTTAQRANHRLKQYFSNVASGNGYSNLITQLGSVNYGVRTTSGTTVTATHTLQAGTNRVGWCIAVTESGNAISSATFGGNAMSTCPERKHNTGNVRCRIFYILDANMPATGSQNFVVTFAGNVTYAVLICGVIQNAYQGAPEATNDGDSNSSPVSFSITPSTANAWIISGAGSNSVGTATFTSYGTGQTQLENRHCGVANQLCLAATYEEKATPAADTQSFSRTDAATQLVGVGAVFKPA